MAEDPDDTRARAEAKFKKQEQAKRESEKVWAEHTAAGRAADEQRARLKALRLAKEALDKDDVQVARAESKRSPKSRPKKST